MKSPGVRHPLYPDTSGKLSPKKPTWTCCYPPAAPAPLPHPRLGPIFQVQDGPSTSYPSLLSHLTSMYLNTPVLALPVAKRQPPGPALCSFRPLASSLPCDFHLLNLRTLQAEVSVPLSADPWGEPCPPRPDSSPSQPCLPGRGAATPVSPAETPPSPRCPVVCYQDDSLPSAETALLLHRKGFDCGLEAKNLGFNCTTSQGKVSRAQVREGRGGQGNRALGMAS